MLRILVSVVLKKWELCIDAQRSLYEYTRTDHQGKYYTGAPGDFAPEMQKRALEKKKIAIDCNVKACSMLQM